MTLLGRGGQFRPGAGFPGTGSGAVWRCGHALARGTAGGGYRGDGLMASDPAAETLRSLAITLEVGGGQAELEALAEQLLSAGCHPL